MQATAKIFKAGNSQALRLPKAFRIDADEVWISKNEVTGEIVLKPIVSAESKLDTLFRLLKETPLPDSFLQERTYAPPRNPLENDDKNNTSDTAEP